MKLKNLLILIMSLIALSCLAQTKLNTSKYGVVDLDSVLITMPETKDIYQKIDSIRDAAYKKAEPIANQFQEKMAQYENLQLSGDTVALKNLETDAQLLYQELNLIEQKAQRIQSGYQQELYKLFQDIKSNISRIAEKMQLTFVIAKNERPIYNSLGLPMIFESPLYYSGEAIDITDIIIKDVLKPSTIKNKALRKMRK